MLLWNKTVQLSSPRSERQAASFHRHGVITGSAFRDSKPDLICRTSSLPNTTALSAKSHKWTVSVSVHMAVNTQIKSLHTTKSKLLGINKFPKFINNIPRNNDRRQKYEKYKKCFFLKDNGKKKNHNRHLSLIIIPPWARAICVVPAAWAWRVMWGRWAWEGEGERNRERHRRTEMELEKEN